MRAYNVVLFIHLLGVVTLFVGIGLQQRVGARLRRASTVQELRLWMGFLRPTGRMIPAAAIILVGSGLYMTAQHWSIGTPWVATGLVAVLAMAAIGAGVLGLRFRAIGIASGASPNGPVPSQLTEMLRAPSTWAVVSALNGTALGVVWLMTNKPGWGASVGIVLSAAAIGAVFGVAMSRRAIRVAARSSRYESEEPFRVETRRAG